MLTRRTFLSSVIGAAAANLGASGRVGEASMYKATEGAKITGLEVIRLREKGGNRVRKFLDDRVWSNIHEGSPSVPNTNLVAASGAVGNADRTGPWTGNRLEPDRTRLGRCLHPCSNNIQSTRNCIAGTWKTASMDACRRSSYTLRSSVCRAFAVASRI